MSSPEHLASEPLFELDERERQIICTLPLALEALSDWHDTQQSQADAMGMNSSAEHHRARRHELRREADRILREWENG